VVYAGDTVSRRHARLAAGPEGPVLTNLSTTNATYLNERAVSETAVSAGDRIRIGTPGYEFRLITTETADGA